jgi:CBS domain containing-hemolysin-like protein
MSASVLGLALLGLLLSAYFSGMETGFYRATRLRLVLDAMAGDRVARGLLFLANRPALFVATTLVGTNLASDLVSLAAVMATQNLFPGSPHLAEMIAPLLLAPLVLVYGELLPKNLALQAPNRLLRRGGPVFLVFTVLLFPIGGLLWGLTRLLRRVVRSSAEPVRAVLARRELRRVLEEGHEAGLLHPAQRTLAQGIFAEASQPVTRFLAPRDQLPIARADMTKHDLLRLAERRHAAAIPVLSAGPAARFVGYVRVIDLRLSPSQQLGPLRPLLEIGEESTHLIALMRLESASESLAQVVSARGETLGIVTLERLREPLL